MRRIALLLVAFFALVGVALAQQATNNTPVTRTAEDNYRVESFKATRDGGGLWDVQVSVRDSGGVEIRRLGFSGPDTAHPSATALAFVTAQMTTVSGETGNNARKMDARVLTFLVAQGYLTGVTVAP